MPYIRIYLHIVWATKNREPLLKKEIRQNVFEHIKQYTQSKDIFLDVIGGWNDHVHGLFSIDATQTIANIMNLIKGETSFWINKNQLTAQKFEWQDDYFVVSVSPKDIERVRNYIRNQETHHSKKTFQQEYNEFLEQCGFEIIKG